MSALPSFEPAPGRLAAVASDVLGWLLHGPMLATSGEESGGVFGWLDAGAGPFVYPELAGYLLTTLRAATVLQPDCVPAARARCEPIVGWIERHARAGKLPATRTYQQPHAPDWRCAPRFTFDLAMLARGLVDAGALVGAERTTPLVQLALGELATMVGEDGGLLACRTEAGAEPLPERWSARPGFYHRKAVAALRVCDVPLTAALASACSGVRGRWQRAPAAIGELHPYLYGIEGMVLDALADGDEALWQQAGNAFAAVLAARLPDGRLPSRFDGGPPRADVLAQALRLGVLLHERRLAGDPRVLADLATALLGFVDPAGSVRFGDGSTAPAHRNGWCAAFTWQALAWLHLGSSGRAVGALGTMLV